MRANRFPREPRAAECPFSRRGIHRRAMGSQLRTVSTKYRRPAPAQVSATSRAEVGGFIAAGTHSLMRAGPSTRLHTTRPLSGGI